MPLLKRTELAEIAVILPSPGITEPTVTMSVFRFPSRIQALLFKVALKVNPLSRVCLSKIGTGVREFRGEFRIGPELSL